MSRYYSDSDSEYINHRRRSNNVRGSGWQSPLPTLTKTGGIPSSSSSTSIIPIVVESPFGLKKYDYSIDTSQYGRLIITAYRRRIPPSDYRSTNNKNHIAIQTFSIPSDADVDHLQSHIERDTNRLIIEIPRQKRAHIRTPRAPNVNNASHAGSRLLRSPDIERMLTSPTNAPQLIRDDQKSSGKISSNNRKLEYRIDCRGYTADELEVFIQGRDLIVQGKTNRLASPDPTQQRVSKKFSRKITLPRTVDLTKVVSYLEHGELRVEAPLKRGVYYNDEEIIIPGPPPQPTASSSLTANLPNATSMLNFENRVRSPSPYYRYHNRHNECMSRRRDYNSSNSRQLLNPTRRVRSVEALRYPLYRSPRELDEDDSQEQDNQRRRTVNCERHNATDRKELDQQSIYRSVHSPATTSMGHHRNYPPDDENYLKF
ncbi:unnamed protein product [Rotaria socialis]|uniref:SHSP domain-containing protein n=1 Tax=Rotaria socialis TaxID=392032 RepID=A0A817SKM5_9BILA|nr:unnamed protein product [Rotaria socialis]CAF3382995.1 unnamed protein product [Rotaria socialis]CAF3416484.1 unnamed protein product [Rotaria socialis]CAF4279611.1 unnamed protein product [Rotaria socialis]CAF4340059.1 unnamed protein product [Rotaria socialis]